MWHRQAQLDIAIVVREIDMCGLLPRDELEVNMQLRQRITPCLWFEKEAEEAASFYVSIFRNSKIGLVTRYSEAGKDTHKRPVGSVMTVEFEIDGQSFTALNGGPVFTFNEAVSLQVNCKDQQEIDYYWDKLSQGGDPKAQQCGWLKDRFGLSWQVVPAALPEMLKDSESTGAKRVMDALMPMKKIDLADLERAFGRVSVTA
jgi:predicted 3-demethylubiquinone-9 3-methyltransferase (glyoxalase superfamily)